MVYICCSRMMNNICLEIVTSWFKVTFGKMYNRKSFFFRKYWMKRHENTVHDDVIAWELFRITGPLWRNSISYQWIPIIKGQLYKVLSVFYCLPDQIVKQTVLHITNLLGSSRFEVKHRRTKMITMDENTSQNTVGWWALKLVFAQGEFVKLVGFHRMGFRGYPWARIMSIDNFKESSTKNKQYYKKIMALS